MRVCNANFPGLVGTECAAGYLSRYRLENRLDNNYTSRTMASSQKKVDGIVIGADVDNVLRSAVLKHRSKSLLTGLQRN